MDGCSYSDIAKKLNADGVLSPTLQREYYRSGEKPSSESKPWNNYEVKRVLQDVHCTGDSVYGKYQQSVFQGNKQRNRPESEWIYAENTHEGIIDKKLFRQVQEKIREFTEEYKKRHQLNNGAIRSQNFYIGKIRCGGCGNRMILSREKSGTFYYICGANANHKSGGNQCKGHRVKKEYMDEDVLRLIQSHMKNVLDTEKMIREMNSASRNQTQYLLLDKEVGKLRRELSRISKRKSDLYEDYSERLITEEEYMQFSRIYSNKIENIKRRLDAVLTAQVRYSKDYHIEEGWGKVIHTYMYSLDLSKKISSAMQTRMKNGTRLPVNARYGYRKGKDGRLEIDPDSAKVVKMIFQMAAEGMSFAEITRELNKQEIATCDEQKMSRGEQVQSRRFDTIMKKRWNPTTVSAIIRDEICNILLSFAFSV